MKSLRKISEYLKNFVLVGAVYAEDVTLNLRPQGEFANLVNYTVPGIIQTALKVILVVAALVSFVYLVIGGIRWITSGGDKDGTAKAQSTITAALIGLIIVFAAWAIIRLLETFFNVRVFNLTIPGIQQVPYTN